MKYRCPICGRLNTDKELFMSHIIDEHWKDILEVLAREGAGDCPKCKNNYHAKNLRTWSVCACGYPIGKWAFRRVAGEWALIYAEK